MNYSKISYLLLSFQTQNDDKIFGKNIAIAAYNNTDISYELQARKRRTDGHKYIT